MCARRRSFPFVISRAATKGPSTLLLSLIYYTREGVPPCAVRIFHGYMPRPPSLSGEIRCEPEPAAIPHIVCKPLKNDLFQPGQ